MLNKRWYFFEQGSGKFGKNFLKGESPTLRFGIGIKLIEIK